MRRQRLEGAALLLAIAVAVIDAAHAADDVAKGALGMVGRTTPDQGISFLRGTTSPPGPSPIAAAILPATAVAAAFTGSEARWA
jgi:hypothetical protein